LSPIEHPETIMAKKTTKPATKTKKTPTKKVAAKKPATKKVDPAVSHDVYFSLKDASAKAKKAFIALGMKYLTAQPGTVWFAMGTLVEEMKREVNDRDFDVALHLVFENKAALDQYAISERHQTFIKETKETWKKVRVFDSFVEG
jgi:hypothetical protein